MFFQRAPLFQTKMYVHLPLQTEWQSKLYPSPQRYPPVHYFLCVAIYGTLEGSNFTCRAEVVKWRVFHPWQNHLGTHVTADLQLYLSFVAQHMEFHGWWSLWKPSLSKVLNMMVSIFLKKRQGQMSMTVKSVLQLWTQLLWRVLKSYALGLAYIYFFHRKLILSLWQ